MNDKELADKVEQRLDLRSKGGIGVMDWQAFGLMVEDAGPSWRLHVDAESGGITFRWFEGKTWMSTTKEFYIKEYGHIRACALAYLEIPNDQ